LLSKLLERKIETRSLKLAHPKAYGLSIAHPVAKEGPSQPLPYQYSNQTGNPAYRASLTI
ncbi:hypothetical protein, partial [Collinsella tanakaei]|uniref:hypothetical protein n=1 Tax=Collinsella tanakaei TaxID=626935 RepID=UPI00265D195E